MVFIMTAKKKLLVLTIGNPYRGDDGAAPVLQSLLQGKLRSSTEQNTNLSVVFEEVYQLQPEHIYDLENADWVLILDAEFNLEQPYRMVRVEASNNPAIGTHSVAPTDLLGYFNKLLSKPAPDCFLFTIRANDFDFVEHLSKPCSDAIQAAIEPLWHWLNKLTDPFDTPREPLGQAATGHHHA